MLFVWVLMLNSYVFVYSCGRSGKCPVDACDEKGYCLYEKFCSHKKLLSIVVVLE